MRRLPGWWHYREPMTAGPVRVVLVDDHEMVIERDSRPC